MKVYIEAFYADATQILGNGDGQGPITAANYKRTNAYKNVLAGKVSKRPKSYRVVTTDDRVLETFDNPSYLQRYTMLEMVAEYGVWACRAGFAAWSRQEGRPNMAAPGFAAWSRAMDRPHMAETSVTRGTVDSESEAPGKRVETLCKAIATRARLRRP